MSDLLATIGASDLPAHQIDPLVGTLNYDGLISDLTMGAIKDQQIRLTSEGPYEVDDPRLLDPGSSACCGKSARRTWEGIIATQKIESGNMAATAHGFSRAGRRSEALIHF